MFMGQLKSIWRAMSSPAFDFQGDLHQQGGAIIVGPGKLPRSISPLLNFSVSKAVYLFFGIPPLTQGHMYILHISTQTAWTTCQ